MPNSLTTQAGLKLGPIVIETFFKHYLERKQESSKTNGSERLDNTLHEQDLLWKESFEILKSFLNQATRHTVEELQQFSNARIPAPPWIYVKSVLVPLSSCDAAAAYLIKALGGEEFTKRAVGGTKWWQVRGMRGVDSQWIWQKSDMRVSRKRQKPREHRTTSEESAVPSNDRFSSFRKLSHHWRNSSPEKEGHASEGSKSREHNKSRRHSERKDTFQEKLEGVDGTRCMLYAHGGGYYFGSVDQERYCLQRYARKIKGRVFAVNYRLAPQYPFPCAIQDMLAAYLYLIEPPPDAMHAPIPPNLIVLGGDSAGGGLCLATLQVMRDSGIPLPAGAVLISPWCDLIHSFPSTLSNTETDIIPPYGLCQHRPSVLWPPPSDEISSRVRANLRERFKAVTKRAVHADALVLPSGNSSLPAVGTIEAEKTKSVQAYSNLNTDATGGQSRGDDCHILLKSEAQDPLLEASDTPGATAKTLPVTDILNSGADFLPVAGKPSLPWDPSQSFDLLVDNKTFTIDTQIQLYCPNNLLVHPLISPVLGYLGGLPPLLVIASDKEVLRDEIVYLAHKAAYPDRFPINEDSKTLYPPLQNIQTPHRPTPVHLQVYDETAHVLPLFSFTTPAKYCYRAIAAFTKYVTPSSDPPGSHILVTTTPQTVSPESETLSTSFFEEPLSDIPASNLHRQSSPSELPGVGSDSGDVAGPRFRKRESQPEGPDTAGSPVVYVDNKWPNEDIMIRERVSIRGVLRPLEPESEIPILRIPTHYLGRINEGVARRYLTGRDLWKVKFHKTAQKIETKRMKNLQLAKSETIRMVKTMSQLQEHLFGEHETPANLSHHSNSRKWVYSFRNNADAERNSWIWTWALDGEHPPPTSIVSRRDTAEARHLARIADLSMEQEESKLSGNMLWSVLVNFLTAQSSPKPEEENDEDGNDSMELRSDDKVSRTRRSQILRRFRSLGGS